VLQVDRAAARRREAAPRVPRRGVPARAGLGCGPVRSDAPAPV